MRDKVDIPPKIVLAMLVFVCALLSACAQGTQDPQAEGRGGERGDGGRSSAIAYEATQGATARPATIMATEDMAATAMASEAGHVAGGPRIPEYEVQKNGTLVIGGDVLVRCRDVGGWTGPESASRSVKRQIRKEQQEQIKTCTKAGFPPDGTAR